MKIIGLSGGVASGKNLTAKAFAKNGAVIFDADKEVHEILKSDEEAISLIKRHFPDSLINGEISRQILGKIVFGDLQKLKILEEIIHKKVRKKYQEFSENAKKNNEEIIILNIPLLLEKEGYKCDYTIAIIADKEIRKQRFIKREMLSKKNESEKDLAEKFDRIVNKQMDDQARTSKADFVIDSSGSKDEVNLQVEKILQKII